MHCVKCNPTVFDLPLMQLLYNLEQLLDDISHLIFFQALFTELQYHLAESCLWLLDNKVLGVHLFEYVHYFDN